MDAHRARPAHSRFGEAIGRAGSAAGKGSEAEGLACRYLLGRGLALLAANYRCRYGELDLVMRDGAQLVVVEVRSRRSERYGAPEASLTRRKIHRLGRAAGCFLRDHPQFNGMILRFDVVGIVTGLNRAPVRWIRNALQFDGH